MRAIIPCLTLFLTMTLAACGPRGLGPWQEEVRLADGREIIVERFEEAEMHTPIGDVGAAFLTNTTIKFVSPPELASLPVLSTRFRPLILDFDPQLGTWIVIAFNERVCMQKIPEAIHEGVMDKTGRINLRPNTEYRLINGKWVETRVGPERIGLPSNLLIERVTVESWKDKGLPVPLSEKLRLDSDTGIPTNLRYIAARVGCA